MAGASQATAKTAAATGVGQRLLTRLCRNTPPHDAFLSRHRPKYRLTSPLRTQRPPDVNQVVPGGKHHERQHQGQPDPKTVFLGTLTQRFPTNRLSGIEQQVPSVKHWHWEQVDQSEIY